MELSCNVGESAKCYSNSGNQFGISLINLYMYLIYVPEILLLDIYCGEIKTIFMQKIHTQMFIIAPLRIFREWKESECASMGRLMNGGTSPQYSSAIKRNEILTHTAIWMNLKDIKLCERNRS